MCVCVSSIFPMPLLHFLFWGEGLLCGVSLLPPPPRLFLHLRSPSLPSHYLSFSLLLPSSPSVSECGGGGSRGTSPPPPNLHSRFRCQIWLCPLLLSQSYSWQCTWPCAGGAALEGDAKHWAAQVTALALQAAVLLPAQALPAWLRRLIWLPSNPTGPSSVEDPDLIPLDPGGLPSFVAGGTVPDQ